MPTKDNYPSEYELEEIFSSIANKAFLYRLAQSKGIIYANSTQREIAKELSILYFDDQDLERIREEAYQISANHTLNGFIVQPVSKNFNLRQTYDSIRESDLIKSGIIPTTLTAQVNDDPKFISVHKGSISYKRHKIGRIEFLQHEESSFDFFIKEAKTGEWQVEIDCNRSTDAKELRDLFEMNLKENADIDTIELDNLTVKQAGKFFDELAKKGMGKPWKCDNVKHVTFRKGKQETKNSSDEEDIVEDDNGGVTEKEASEEELIEIRQAVLEGKNLRDNKVVKEFENSGYKFTAMTYEFLNKSEIIEIKAEFKGRPKVFEVSVKNSEQFTNLGSIRKPLTLTALRDREIRSIFWNNAKKIYDGR